MIWHLFKLSWNKRKKHLVLVVELFFAYLVTSFLILFIFEAARHFQSANFNVDNLVMVYRPDSSSQLKYNIRALPEVLTVSETDLMPYFNIINDDTVKYKGSILRSYQWKSDENLVLALGLTLRSGSWFEASDKNAVKKPVVLTVALSELLMPGERPEGKTIKVGKHEYTVKGVVENLNDPTGNYNNRPHLFTMNDGHVLLVKLKKPMSTATYRKLKTTLSGYSNEFSDNIELVSKRKETHLSSNRAVTFVVGFLCVFLLVNVVLGLFSMLHQSINKKRSEIGVRRASGATKNDIYRQIVIEVMLLTTIGVIPAIIVAWQFVLFNVFGDTAVYYPSMLIAAVVIYLLVILCALYPANLASKIQPAEALHEE